jgi:hypothetical protein
MQAGSAERRFPGEISMNLREIGKKGWNFRHF